MNKIVNVRGLPPNHPSVIYCGREWTGWTASPLANPFLIGRDGSRDEVIEKCRLRLRELIAAGNGPVLDALAQIKPDSVLGCWCIPRRCHCEVIWDEWHKLQPGIDFTFDGTRLDILVKGQGDFADVRAVQVKLEPVSITITAEAGSCELNPHTLDEQDREKLRELLRAIGYKRRPGWTWLK